MTLILSENWAKIFNLRSISMIRILKIIMIVFVHSIKANSTESVAPSALMYPPTTIS